MQLLPSKKFLLDLLKDKNLYKLAEKMTIAKNELLEMSQEAQENYLKEIKIEDCLDVHLDSMNINTLRLVLESNTILTNISFNSDTNVIIETGKSLNIAGLLTIGSGSTLNISGEGTLTLGSNIVSKNIIENINYKGITPEILLNNTIALNLNFTEENIYNNLDTIILGNIDSEI